MGRRSDRFKRGFDVLVGGSLFVVTLPIQAGVALAVRTQLGSPVLFRQPRPGKDGEVFELVKFRTMHHASASRTTDAERLTTLGKVLRKTSLDELPTLWNVIKGEMSLVGPRPLLVQYLPHYSPRQARRHEVRPGVTGLAQVSGRNALSWEDLFELDVTYVEERSFALDLKILALTAWKVVAGSDVNQAGVATAEAWVPLEPAEGSAPRSR